MRTSLIATGLLVIGCAIGVPTYVATSEPGELNITQALIEHGVDADLLAALPIEKRDLPDHLACIVLCEVLTKVFSNNTYSRGTSECASFQASYWSKQQAEVRPQCVFVPKTPAELSIGILLTRLTQCPFAAKSGGHAAFASASSIQDGLAISLSKLDAITIADDRSCVEVGPGNKWQKVYETTEKAGLIILGGRDGDIGVGGLTTGGGVSLFSSEHGWACDNVISYEVVSAWGEILEVSATSHADLYWALRGGGNNFGIVTNFRFEAHPVGDIWGGAIGWTSEAFPDLIEAYYDLGVNSPTDPKAASILSFSATGSTLGNIAQTLVSYSLPLPSPQILSRITSVPNPIYDTTSIRSVSNYSSNFASWPAGTRDEIWTHTSLLSIDFMTFIQATLFEIAPRIQDQTTGLRVSASFQAITQGMLDNMNKNGGNALGLAGMDGPLLLLSQAWIWDNAEDDSVVWSGIHEFRSKVEAKGIEMQVNVPYRYMNYANMYQDVIASYGEENKARLKAVGSKYDPTGVFQRLQPGYFKLEGAPVARLNSD